MTPPYILVADDDPSILYLVADILRDEGYAIELARNGREALEVIERREAPALVILDMRMPVIDGWAFASALRSMQLEVPILVMTAARNAREWAAEIEAVGYLAKPFDLDDFLREVNRLAPRPGAAPGDGASSDGDRLFALLRPTPLLGALRRVMTRPAQKVSARS